MSENRASELNNVQAKAKPMALVLLGLAIGTLVTLIMAALHAMSFIVPAVFAVATAALVFVLRSKSKKGSSDIAVVEEEIEEQPVAVRESFTPRHTKVKHEETSVKDRKPQAITDVDEFIESLRNEKPIKSKPRAVRKIREVYATNDALFDLQTSPVLVADADVDPYTEPAESAEEFIEDDIQPVVVESNLPDVDTWEATAGPQPSYMNAPKAPEREVPVALEVEAPQATERAHINPKPVFNTPAAPQPLEATPTTRARREITLDDVLRRRRA